MRNKSHMLISINAEKAFDKTLSWLRKKKTQQTRNRKELLNLIKGLHKKKGGTTNTIHDEDWLPSAEDQEQNIDNYSPYLY